MSASLAQQQTVLLELLRGSIAKTRQPGADRSSWERVLGGPHAQTERGLQAYRANANALAERSLSACYPTLQLLIGEANFSHIARDLWHAYPPVRGDVAQWGGRLPAFLRELPQLETLIADNPYLQDVAALEWALHQANSAADSSLNAQSLQLLAQRDPQELALEFSAGCAVLPSEYPLVAIWQLHDPRSVESYSEARACIDEGRAQTALVWRQGLRPSVMALPPSEATLIQSTIAGFPLSQALDDALVMDAQFDFGAWLAQAVQTGLLVGVRLAD